MLPDTEMLADDELRISRDLDAPPELVFRLWTDPMHVVRWMGPDGFDCPSFELDLREGGAWRGCIRSAEYGENWMSGVYREIIPGRRLVFTFTWDDGPETLVTIDFEALDGGRTRQTFHQTPFETVETRDSHVGGWASAFDCEAGYLEQIAKGADR